MANRHLSRSIVLQSLFEWDFVDRKDDKKKVDSAFIENILRRNIEEFAPGLSLPEKGKRGSGDFLFMEKLITGIIEKQKDLNSIIEKAAPDWPIDKIAMVDRNILRLGLYELLFVDRSDVPAKVAINEAIELAKTFGGESSSRFVNGVLGSVYKEIGEPGKDEKTKKKKGEVAFDDMPIEKLGGAIVFAKEGQEFYLAFVHDVFGYWTLSKGHVEEGESVEEGTMREIKEELGVDMKIMRELGNNEYVASHPEKGKIRKQVTYFLGEAPYIDLTLGTSGGLDDAKWFRLPEIIDLQMYDDILPLVTKAINILLKR